MDKYRISEKIGNKARQTILDRTRKGIDVQGNKFKPKRDGTASYVKHTGKMLRSIKIKPTETSVVLSVDTPYAEKVNQTREFMGLSEEEANKIAREMEEELATEFEEMLNGSIQNYR